MLRAMDSAVAGLRAHQNKLDVIGHNIANVNTAGYKTQTYNFKEAMYQTSTSSTSGSGSSGGSGGVNPAQYGYGTLMGSISVDMDSSTPTQTGGLTATIDGQGFFITGPRINTVEISSDDVEGSSETIKESDFQYTRVGQFKIDNEGYLVDCNSNNFIYGFRLPNALDEASAENFDMNNLVPIRVCTVDGDFVDGDGEIAQAVNVKIDNEGKITIGIKRESTIQSTVTVKYPQLESTTEVDTTNATFGIDITDSEGNVYQTVVIPSTPKTYYRDEQGNNHEEQGEKLALADYVTDNKVTVYVNNTPRTYCLGKIDPDDGKEYYVWEKDLTEGAPPADFKGFTTTLDGKQYYFKGTAPLTEDQLLKMGVPGTENLDGSISLSSGKNNDKTGQNQWWIGTINGEKYIFKDKGEATGTITKNGGEFGSVDRTTGEVIFNSKAETKLVWQDNGKYYAVKTDTAGQPKLGTKHPLTGESQTKAGDTSTTVEETVEAVIGRVAIATFQNQEGLTKAGSSYYTASKTDNTGLVSATGAGLGAASLMTGYLEASNVDMAKEFSELITTQRGFQANSKIITVSDQILEELVNMKR